jgi:DNA polymerase-2
LLDEIVSRTHLPIALEGIYRWVAFLPSRVDERVPAANRYFGVFQDGSIKVRGVEARRRDTPPFIASVQMAILERLAAASDASQLTEYIPGIIAFLRRQLRLLRRRQVPVEELLATQKLSRELELYRSPSPAARAAAQLEAIGKPVRPGLPIRFLYTCGEPGVHAWDCPPPPAPDRLDIDTYSKLFVRACTAVLQPLGVFSTAGAADEELRSWLFSGEAPLARPAQLPLSGK